MKSDIIILKKLKTNNTEIESSPFSKTSTFCCTSKKKTFGPTSNSKANPSNNKPNKMNSKGIWFCFYRAACQLFRKKYTCHINNIKTKNLRNTYQLFQNLGLIFGFNSKKQCSLYSTELAQPQNKNTKILCIIIGCSTILRYSTFASFMDLTIKRSLNNSSKTCINAPLKSTTQIFNKC